MERLTAHLDDHIAAPALTNLLRARTAAAHVRTEQLLGLPQSIADRSEYIGWLRRFLALYAPLERRLAQFEEWRGAGIALPSPGHAACLADDLAALGVDPAEVRPAPPAALPDLAQFAHAVGALYVLEGATLGGRLILRDLDSRIDGLAGATAFFGGRGAALGPMWRGFRQAVDGFGRQRPEACEQAVDGANRTFAALLAWFTPFRAGANRAAGAA